MNKVCLLSNELYFKIITGPNWFTCKLNPMEMSSILLLSLECKDICGKSNFWISTLESKIPLPVPSEKVLGSRDQT